jgi:MinD-like ATPase involved in chromosome partitioning or flagellar assembly
MIVIVGNTQGGTGKTTLPVQIALARQVAARAVLLIDNVCNVMEVVHGNHAAIEAE